MPYVYVFSKFEKDKDTSVPIFNDYQKFLDKLKEETGVIINNYSIFKECDINHLLNQTVVFPKIYNCTNNIYYITNEI